MGVTSLWSVIEPAGKAHSLTEDAGQILAIDLASWVVPGVKVAKKRHFKNETYIMIRTIFFRTMNLLKLGVKPLFVVDGEAPAVKQDALSRRQTAVGDNSKSADQNRAKFREVTDKCKKLFEALCIPYIQSAGEAEKLCACLNHNQMVDACLCDDSDVFLYGATTVYRNFNFSQVDTTVTKYTMNDVEEKVQLDRRCLIAFALLSGSDYGDGVRGIGVKKAVELIESLRGKGEDILHRILGWKDNENLKQLAALLEQNSSKPVHCSKCIHPGSLTNHKSAGCSVCKTENSCTSSSHDCPCSWHQAQSRLKPFLLELAAREKALKIKDFPRKEVVDEFLVDDVVAMKRFEWKIPEDLNSVKTILRFYLKWDESEVRKKLLPVFVHMQLHETVTTTEFEPVRIEKTCKENFKYCFKTLWKYKDAQTDSSTFEVVVEEDLFANTYREMTEEFKRLSAEKLASSPGRKCSLKTKCKQQTVDLVFKKFKRKHDLETNTRTEEDASVNKKQNKSHSESRNTN